MNNDLKEPEQPAARAQSPSRIRDHLANERTFLAWIRTALGLIGIGFVLARMGLFLRQLALIGAVGQVRGARGGHEFLVTGVVFLILGTFFGGWTGWLYRRNRLAIDEGRYQPAGPAVAALSLLVMVGGLVIVGLVIWRTLGSE